jgi:hypothetical protein
MKVQKAASANNQDYSQQRGDDHYFTLTWQEYVSRSCNRSFVCRLKYQTAKRLPHEYFHLETGEDRIFLSRMLENLLPMDTPNKNTIKSHQVL